MALFTTICRGMVVPDLFESLYPNKPEVNEFTKVEESLNSTNTFADAPDVLITLVFDEEVVAE